ncbi:MAG: signal peptidase I [Clostridiales bacterium]|nr:MAG: signal peptidase I [Clostridiales bacterium]
MLEIIEWAKSIAFALFIGALIIVFARPSLVIGPSMEPTFENGQLVLVEKVSYFLHEPQRGDIVVAQTNLPLNRWFNKAVIKRVIGLPGDVIKISNGEVYVNGERYYESYLKDDFILLGGEWKVPANSIFVMGDNRNDSNDSRSSSVGYIDYSAIKGKVYLRIFPFNQFSSF